MNFNFRINIYWSRIFLTFLLFGNASTFAMELNEPNFREKEVYVAKLKKMIKKEFQYDIRVGLDEYIKLGSLTEELKDRTRKYLKPSSDLRDEVIEILNTARILYDAFISAETIQLFNQLKKTMGEKRNFRFEKNPFTFTYYGKTDETHISLCALDLEKISKVCSIQFVSIHDVDGTMDTDSGKKYLLKQQKWIDRFRYMINTFIKKLEAYPKTWEEDNNDEYSPEYSPEDSLEDFG